MLTTAQPDAATRALLLARLRSIEGQARGVQRMLEDGRECQAILDQLAALRAASHAVTLLALERFATNCLQDERPEVVLAHMVGLVKHLTR